MEAAAKKAFGIGMGPFELMNVTGVPIALHAATTLGRAFGPLYAPPALLRQQVRVGRAVGPLAASPTRRGATRSRTAWPRSSSTSRRALVDEEVGTIEDTDIGARVGLRWRRGPFELMNHYGIGRAAGLVGDVARRWQVPVPRMLASARREPFRFTLRARARWRTAWPR